MATVAMPLLPAAPQLHGLVHQHSDKLWSEALSSLKPDVRESLLSVEGDRRATLEVVLFEARSKREISLRKQWKITKKNGDIIILRDVFEKIIQWVDKFKAIGDYAVQAAPSYAAIPWNVVCVLIKVAINESEEFAAMIDGLQEVTNIIARYAIFETVYLQQPTSATGHLEASLVALYAAVLSFLCEAETQFSRSAAKRLLRSAVGAASDIEEALELIRSRQAEVERTAQIAGMEILQNTSTAMHELVTMVGNLALQLNVANYRLQQLQSSGPIKSRPSSESLKRVVTSIMGPTQRMSQQGPLIIDELSPEGREIIFDWLSPVNYRTHHLVETKGRLPNSGAWMFRSPQFRNWRDSSISETIWLHGMPGCGKTKLASAVVDLDLGSDAIDDSNAAPLAYFYCSRNSAEPERSDPDEVLRCIARQLCRDNTAAFVYEPLKHLYEGADRPRLGEKRIDNDTCVDLILKALGDNPATIVIDALDELEPDKRHRMFDSLDRIVKQSPNVIKVFLTSRDDLDIKIRLLSTPNLYISASSNQIDIEYFIDTKIREAVDQKRLLAGNVSVELKLKIKEAFSSRAGGMFRWVSLQMSNLCDSRRMQTQGDVLRELAQLPESLHDLYSIAFHQIDQLHPHDRHIARNALRLLLVAVRPIPWAEFLHLLSAISDDSSQTVLKANVVNITGNFLLDDDLSGVPRFSHRSAREYLESRPDFGISSANASAAYICLQHLKLPGTWDSRNFSYSSFYLGNHLGKTIERQRDGYRHLLHELLLPKQDDNQEETELEPPMSELFLKWRRRISGFQKIGYLKHNMLDAAESCQATMVSTKPAFAICAMGLAEFLPLLPWESIKMSGLPSINFSNLGFVGSDALCKFQQRDCFEIAVLFNQPDIFVAMHNLNLDIGRIGMSLEKLLHLAAEQGNERILRLLLSFGANPDSFSLEEVKSGDGRLNRINLTDDGEQASRDQEHISIAHRPATSMGFHIRVNGRSEIRSPFFFKEERRATIHLAMHTSSGASCVQSLIEYGADVNLKTSNGVTPLEYCLEYSNLDITYEVFKILLAAGARTDGVLQGGQSIVHIVAAMGLANIIRLLLDSGVNCVVEDHHGQTPSDLAHRLGHTEVTALLADHTMQYKCIKPQNSRLPVKHHSTSDIPLFNIEDYETGTTIDSDGTGSFDGGHLDPSVPSKRSRLFNKLVKGEWAQLTARR